MKTTKKPCHKKIALISSEAVPWAKTGGLGDMVGSLGRHLSGLGHGVILILPKYRWISPAALRPRGTLTLSMADKVQPVTLWEGGAPEGGLVLFLDMPAFFGRPSLYGDGIKDYPDNAERFAAFSLGSLEALKSLNIRPDVLHANDWQGALVPFLLKTTYARDPFFQDARSVLTLHNLGYQGLFPREVLRRTGLDERFFTPRLLEFHGLVNFLKAGIVAADGLTTVSPAYAREILTPEFGCGLEGVLRERDGALAGILNGIDTGTWNSAADPHIAAPYATGNLEGKDVCKRSLQRELGLPELGDVPLLAVIGRLVPQKGIDLAIQVAENPDTPEAQWVFLGRGDPALEESLRRLAAGRPDRVAVRTVFDSPLSHRITAGADLLLMPSRYEPCGYNQMYAQRYGTIPVVRSVGGLRDTVDDCEGDHGTGFVFEGATADALAAAIERAIAWFRRPGDWKRLQRRAMSRDFSWDLPAGAYETLYEKTLAAPPRPLLDGEFSKTS
ncbi:MAG TPA: glycogen synthase GlgA [bacterium]|nr:glycogen synthase GlgA [bacterium]